MNVVAPIIALVAADATAFGLVGDRIYPSLAPQEAPYPLAVITIVTNNPANTKSGPSTVDNVGIQLDVYATTYAVASRTSEAIRRAIEFFRGDVVYQSVTYSVDGIRYDSTQTDVTTENDLVLYRYIDSYTIRVLREGVGANPPMYGSALQVFDSDADAIAAGLEVGQWYILSWTNIYNSMGDTPKKVSPP